jgi:hypothetical protein
MYKTDPQRLKRPCCQFKTVSKVQDIPKKLHNTTLTTTEQEQLYSHFQLFTHKLQLPLKHTYDKY